MIKLILILFFSIFLFSAGISAFASTGKIEWKTLFHRASSGHRMDLKVDIHTYEDAENICYIASAKVPHGTDVAISCLPKKSE